MGALPSARAMPSRQRTYVLIALLACLGLLLIAGRLMVSRPLRVSVNPALEEAGAWRVGHNQPILGSNIQDIEVVSRRQPDGRLHLTVRQHRPPYTYQTEIWLKEEGDGVPAVEVNVRSFESSGITWPAQRIGGMVRVSSPRFPASRSAPLVVDYDLEADISGSPVPIRGRVVVTAEQIR